MHISAVGSDAVASKFFVAYFRVGATNSFAQAKEFAHTHTHTCALMLGKQINRRVLRALWLGLVGVTGAAAGAAHKVTPHLTENHIKTR